MSVDLVSEDTRFLLNVEVADYVENADYAEL
jgi:hypothetical protein